MKIYVCDTTCPGGGGGLRCADCPGKNNIEDAWELTEILINPPNDNRFTNSLLSRGDDRREVFLNIQD